MSRPVKVFEMISDSIRITGTASELAKALHYCRQNIYMAYYRKCKIGKKWTIRELTAEDRKDSVC